MSDEGNPVRSIRREWWGVSAYDTFRIVPIGDVHIGHRGCDEGALRSLVKQIEEDDNTWWIGMGDYIDAINRNDPRFDPCGLADWLTMSDLADIGRAQARRFLSIVEPIASKCLVLLTGNHEAQMMKWSERDIFSDIVMQMKEWQGQPDDYQLTLPDKYYGWLDLAFHRVPEGSKRAGTQKLQFYLHHGFGGGKLQGAKALNMQRWLWTHAADVALFGHTHNVLIQKEAVEICRGGKVQTQVRYGGYGGSFLRDAGYAVVKGMLPLPPGGVLAELRPLSERAKIRLIAD